MPPPPSREALLGGAALAGLAAWAVRQRMQPDWEATLERVSHGVVVVRVSSVMAFDMNVVITA